ncbi:MAG TPA: hypothetical protein VM184_08015 [Gaiellaceae bacterium]|nr:hypothetical protein [Gaiellaceae bacterium]
MCVLLAAGCGSEERAPAPQLPGALAERLALRSDAVADRLDQGDECAARAEAEALQAETIAAVNERRVPPALQEELVGSVTALVESIECLPPPPVAEEGDDDEEDNEDDDDEDRGKGKKKGKNGKDGDDD